MIVPFRSGLCTTVEVNPDEAGLIDLMMMRMPDKPRLTDFRDRARLSEELEQIVRTGMHPEVRIISISYRYPEGEKSDYVAEVVGIPPRMSGHTRWNVQIKVVV